MIHTLTGLRISGSQNKIFGAFTTAVSCVGNNQFSPRSRLAASTL